MTEELYRELLNRGMELLKEQDEDVLHAVTIDHNHDISSIAAAISHCYAVLPEEQAITVCKSMAETLFHLGYLAGKEESNLSIWEDQL